MKDRQPGAPGQYQASISQEELAKLMSGERFKIVLTRDDQPTVPGTPYSKAAVLPDELAAVLCPDIEDPTPADAFAGLKKLIDELTAADVGAQSTINYGTEPPTGGEDGDVYIQIIE